MDSKMHTSLLPGGHLDGPERIKRGLWSPPPIELSAVVGHLAKALQSEKWIPREWKPVVLGNLVWEGGVIERQYPSPYVYRSRRSQPTKPDMLAEQTEKVFSSAEEAAHYYLNWNLES